MKRPKDSQALRFAFFEEIQTGRLTLQQALKKMRKIAGKTQTEYAQMLGIAPRVLIDLERGVGNPTLKTLEKLGAPFGLRVVFYPKR